MCTGGVEKKKTGALRVNNIEMGGMGGICSDKHPKISPTASNLPDLHSRYYLPSMVIEHSHNFKQHYAQEFETNIVNTTKLHRNV